MPKSPVILIGTTRSGKTTLARILESCPSARLWSEPNALLKTGHAWRKTSLATAEDAKPWVMRHIRRMCLQYQEAHHGARLLIDSPIATFKILFLHKVLPEAKFLFFYRDGRHAVAYRLMRMQGNAPWRYNVRAAGTWVRLRQQLELTSPRDTPAFIWQGLGGLMHRYLFNTPVWTGMRYPGWEKDHRCLNAAQAAAKTWSVANTYAFNTLKMLPPESSMTVRLENVMENPRDQLTRIIDFCGLAADESLINDAEKHLSDLAISHHAMNLEVSPDVMPYLEEGLRELGYIS